MFHKPKRIEPERCICGELPNFIYDFRTGNYGAICPKCRRRTRVVCYDEESAIELWNKKKDEWEQEQADDGRK